MSRLRTALPPLAALALLLAPMVCNAAEVIGRAIDAKGAPLPTTEVRLGAVTVRADAEGRFVFRNVVPGTHELSCGGAAERVTVRDGINQVVCRRQ
jgi:hypothetical protein